MEYYKLLYITNDIKQNNPFYRFKSVVEILDQLISNQLIKIKFKIYKTLGTCVINSSVIIIRISYLPFYAMDYVYVCIFVESHMNLLQTYIRLHTELCLVLHHPPTIYVCALLFYLDHIYSSYFYVYSATGYDI